MVEYLIITTYSFDESHDFERKICWFKATGRRHVNKIYLGI